MNDIVLLILNNGESVIGEEQDGNDLETFDGVFLKGLLGFAPNAEGTGVVSVPYIPFADEDMAPFRSRDIRHHLKPNKDLVTFYQRHFGKIETANGNIVVA